VAASTEQQAQITLLATRVEAFRASIAQGLDQATFARRRELVELLIDRVLVDGDQVELRSIIPFGGTTDRKVALQSGHLAVSCPHRRLFREFRAAGSEIGIGGAKIGKDRLFRAYNGRFPVVNPHLIAQFQWAARN